MRNIFIISGPSGAGEDSIIAGLSKLLPIEKIITTVTRPKRIGESSGHPYYFISEKEFEQKIERGDLAEYAQHYNGNYYGVTKKELERVAGSGKIGLWKIDYRGVETAKQLFPSIIAIFIIAPLEILEKRIRTRDNLTEEYISERMEYTKEWLKHTDIYDYTIENGQGKLDEAIQKAYAIITEHTATA
ncbi:MAG: hypothetical protein A3E38_02260 [Candidatus Moranbacteria bacterium RIFCSPHIGHO2_12_FULL_54_9]|nr:MAG: hypothetical protein A2878_03055 [Candidatus Moranbacteria bacterium RIFCSPHIGHO2_01_FULL_54_31]OGI24969.1 MAG: hypothetical protein A3E38_02260 [Candidatus Moranbacteria bacterium RIFCSPHIGHO2_12_FULL_54_9]